jgi:hypothetical protein
VEDHFKQIQFSPFQGYIVPMSPYMQILLSSRLDPGFPRSDVELGLNMLSRAAIVKNVFHDVRMLKRP